MDLGERSGSGGAGGGGIRQQAVKDAGLLEAWVGAYLLL